MVNMVKGKPNIRSFFQSKKDSPSKTTEGTHNSAPVRPPLAAFPASAENNHGPKAKRTGHFPGQISYPHLENVDSNVECSSSNASSPKRFSTPCGTPLKSKSMRSPSACNRLPLGSNDFETMQGLNSAASSYGGCLSRTPSNPSSMATISDEEASTMEESAPSSTSGSDAENIVCLSRQASAERREGLRRMSLGPKIEAAASKLKTKTPTKPLRPGRNRTPCASPGSLRPGAQRALVVQQPSLKDHSHGQAHFDLQENFSFWDDHNVQVVIRTRPISGKEAAKQDVNRCLRQDSAHAITWLGQPETRFTFDHVAGENISQEKLFNVVGLPIVENCMAGYNSCMFAYGQTGSGKTHTMLGDIAGLGEIPNDNRGMTPRIFEYLFSRILKEEQDRHLEQLRYVCKCSFLEIYNEQITDLLEPSSSNLQMREDSKKGVYVENLTEMVVSSVQDVLVLLLKGGANRKVASTNMNRESSRSHSVFTCSLESKWETNSLSNTRFGRLNLVDLAGSERQKSSGAEGDRLKEAASINKSLSTLGLVIMILVDIANGKQRHVPYRDSKLTFLLQDSLGGNSKTAIIATISPSSCCSMETLSTLKFAQRAKFIQNNAVVNEDASGELLALRREIQELKEEVSRLRCQSISSMRRECRRESNEFFRMSMTGRDLFDAAEKECTDEGADLKSDELLGKIKALEAVLAGALRREQIADTATRQLSYEIEKANKLIEEREIQVRNCKNLLHIHSDESERPQPSQDIESSNSRQHTMFVDKLESAEELEHNPTVTKLELENTRLTEQLRSYQAYFDAGERETMTSEIQGLRDQVLELLDGKVGVERGSLPTTIAQGDNYRKELETCRNDLTNCLEASSQLQRQADELQTLVNQLTEQCAEKEKQLDKMTESTEKYVNMLKLKEEEIKSMQTGWETAIAKLFRDLVEGERALLEAGQEMEEMIGEDLLLKPSRWSIESGKSLKEVDMEHDFFKGRDSCGTHDIFVEKSGSKRKRSFGATPRVSIMIEQRLKLEATVARLEQEIEEYKLCAQNELERVEREKLRQKDELEVKIPLTEKLDFEAVSMAESHATNLKSGQIHICELETSLAEKYEALAMLESAVVSATATCDAVRRERDEAEAQVEHLRDVAISRCTQLQEVREKLDLKSNELEIFYVMMQSISTEVNTQSMQFENRSRALSQELEHERAAFEALQHQFLSLTTALQQNNDELRESKIKEDSLLTELLGLKEQLSRSEGNVDVTREAETRLRGEILAMTETLKCTKLEENRLNGELASARALMLEHGSTITDMQQKIEIDAQTIVSLNETVEELQTKLQRKEDLLYGLEFDISLLQEHAAEDTDFKQELLKANAKILELQEEAQTSFDELKIVCSAKNDVVEQLAHKAAAMKLVEDEMVKLETDVALVTNESGALNSRISQLQTAMNAMEAELAEKTEALSSLGKDLMLTRVTSTRMTMECSHKTETLSSLQGEILRVLEERDHLKAQCTTLVQTVDSFEAEKAQHVAEVESLQGEILVSMMTECCLQELMSDTKAKLGELELHKGVVEHELEIAKKNHSSLQDEVQRLRNRLADCQELNEVLKLELAKTNTAMSSLQDDLSTITLGFRSDDHQRIKALEAEIEALMKERDSFQTKVLLQKSMAVKNFVESESVESRRPAGCVSDENSALRAQILELQAEKGASEAELSSKMAFIMSLEEELAAARSSSLSLREELPYFGDQNLGLQASKRAMETEIAEERASIGTITSSEVEKNDIKLRMQIETWQQKCCTLETQLAEAGQEMDTMKAQNSQQELQLSSLEELLDRAEAEALQLMATKANHAAEECDNLRSEVERLDSLLYTKVAELKAQEDVFKALEESRMVSVGNASEELWILKDERDKALEEVQALDDELRTAQSLVTTLKSSALAAQKLAEVCSLRVSEKEKEARTLEASVSTLKNQNRALETQLQVTKFESDKLRQGRDELEMELQGMKNRMSMLQAVHSTGSRNFKGFQAAQSASFDLQRRFEEKEAEVTHMHKRMAALQSQSEAQKCRVEEMETELSHVHRELDELHSRCADKDAQLSALKTLNKEAEALTQDVMRDLHNVKFDIGNYAALASQQQQELITERSRHAEEAREKDEEVSNLRTQLNQERQNWMLEMNHKQAEIVVGRVLSEKMRLKNKALAAEYKRLKADYSEKKKRFKLLEQQLTQLTTDTRRVSMDTESEADFDEVQQFQALLAQANDTRRFSMGKESEADFDEVQQFQALLAQANDHGLAQRQ